MLGFHDTDGAAEYGDQPSDSPVIRWEERRAGDFVEVTAHYDSDSRLRRVWLLNPSMGMQPTRCSAWLGDEEITRCETSYDFSEGRWFPSASTFYFRGQPRASLSVVAASFDKPWHDQELTLGDLGVVPGIQILEAGQPVRI
ncbi:MAG: hypothetical protein BroJett003_20320 [Planctomycetota bacterium]|nr:MAG: hypothetical protein BroJett003_20320 [Planctomycetota bacterium]